MGGGGRDGHGMGREGFLEEAVVVCGLWGISRPTAVDGLVGGRTSTRRVTEEGTSLERRKDDTSPLAGKVSGETGGGSQKAPAPPRPEPQVSPPPPQPPA